MRDRNSARMTTPKNKGGRPSKKSSLDLRQVERLARKGWIDDEMADFFEVSVRTWLRWKAEDEEFCHALKSWKEEADARVERSLYERATGYSHPDTHISNYQGETTQTPIIKRYPPDTTAAIFWLKNRDPESWRDKQDLDVHVTDLAARMARMKERKARGED